MKLNRAAAIAFACNIHHQFVNAVELIRAMEGTSIANHYIVTLKDEGESTKSVQGKAEGITDKIQGQLTQVYTNVMHGFAVSLSDEALNDVLNDDRVMSVEEDATVQLDAFGSWGLDHIGEIDLPLHQSHIPTTGNDGAGVTVYVIDTGIVASHDDFEGRATQEFNSVSGEPNEDCNGHGTHIAGVVGSKTFGVANEAKLVGVKVLSCSGKGSYSGVIAGIDWVKENAKKPATANMNFSGSKSNAMNTAVKNLVNSGVSTVVTAGNSDGDECQKSPASVVSAITVSSMSITDARSSFSNGGSCVNIFAPDSGIEAPYIDSASAKRTLSATSMASPHVCGIVALYLGQDSKLSPTAVSLKILADFDSKKSLNSGSGTSNRMLVVGGGGKKQFNSSSEVQGQVRIYCRHPAKYDTTEYGPMQYWDVSRVTSMFQVFNMYYNNKTNKCDIPDISGWDVSQVTDFRWMFYSATSFNQNISNWDVSKGTSFSVMFGRATSFNQNIGNWDVSKSTSFSWMFGRVTSFNQNIGKWDVSKGTDFRWMFYYATSFNKNIRKWDVSKGTSFSWMFGHATSFNQNIGKWDVSKGTDFSYVFYYATSFNLDIGKWDVSKGTDFSYMFFGASTFKQNLNIWMEWVIKTPKKNNWCGDGDGDGTVCDASVAPTSIPSIEPSTSSLVTPSIVPSTAPTENKNHCDRKSERVCKKLKDACVFGKSKIFGACKPRSSNDMHNCAGYDDKKSCTGDKNHGGLCKFNHYGCSHVCDGLNKKRCTKLRNTNNKMTCKPTNTRNPCKGCQHKTICG